MRRLALCNIVRPYSNACPFFGSRLECKYGHGFDRQITDCVINTRFACLVEFKAKSDNGNLCQSGGKEANRLHIFETVYLGGILAQSRGGVHK